LTPSRALASRRPPPAAATDLCFLIKSKPHYVATHDRTRVLEGQASELAPVVSPEQVDPEKRENVRNSFLSTFGLAEDDDDDDDA